MTTVRASGLAPIPGRQLILSLRFSLCFPLPPSLPPSLPSSPLALALTQRHARAHAQTALQPDQHTYMLLLNLIAVIAKEDKTAQPSAAKEVLNVLSQVSSDRSDLRVFTDYRMCSLTIARVLLR